ncbi:Protein abrupt [Pseudolycoriella hygida]|uniref:Protein abrupt n=1 Tax=Pseudolycoriella hygida TaxID=35572 RepID=A0A9Q0NBL4_9DIPT|nr:Protein abrupt [Pseudolycoriella hygida]
MKHSVLRGLADVTGPQSRTSNSTVNSTLTKTPAVQEHKPSPTSTSLPWDLPDDRSNHLTPPPQKRIKSVDLYRAQHGISPSDLELCKDTDIQPIPAHHRQRNRNSDRSRDTSRDLSRSRERSRESTRERERDRSGDMRESLLGQALEGGPTLIVPSKQSHPDLATLQAQSTGEDSNSSDTAASDRGDMDHDELNGSMDHPRHSFPSFLNLQGIPGLLPGPSGMHGADSFDVQQSCAAIKKEVEYSPSSSGSLSSGTSVALESGPVSRRQLEMRVRATDPRPCPKCGKIYRSAHTLRTHLEDKHTVCPGYRCVLCGTVAKSRNSLHSHMSRQHRGISTKDLPVLPMPSPFDPDLASRLLAKAGVKISPAELRARASPTSGTRRSDIKLEFRGPGEESNMNDDMDDPEDLTMGSGHGHNNNNMSGRYHDSMIGFSHPNTTITRVRHGAVTPKSVDSKESHGTPLPPTAATGSSILDTYLQFITENTFGIGMSQEHAAAAFHAAKMAQLNAMGHNLDKLPSSLLPSHLDLSKVNSHNNTDLSRIQSTGSVTIEPANPKVPTSISHNDRADIRRDTEPMDLGYDNQQQQHNNMNDRDNSSGEDDNYSDDDGEQNTL